MILTNKTKSIIFQISAIVILLAAIVYSFHPIIAKYAMILGVAGYASTTFTSPYPGKDIRGKRLFNISIFAVLLMVVSAYLMFVDMSQWVITLLIAAVLTLYCSIILPRVYKKEQEENSNTKKKS
jgi:phosphatidylserine synthase